MAGSVDLDEPAEWDDSNTNPDACRQLFAAILGMFVKDAIDAGSTASLSGRWVETLCDFVDLDPVAFREGVARQIGIRRAA